MRLPDRIINSAFFVGTKSGSEFKPRATAFLVIGGGNADGEFGYLHMVTAEHVITALFDKQSRGVPGFEEIVLRFNSTDGGTVELPTRRHEWRFHPDTANKTDVAVAPCSPPIGTDTLHVPAHMIATAEIIKDRMIGVGDGISIIGLFRAHSGQGKNIPIVRTGNIASMTDEPVYTKYAGYIEGILIEARSISGLSGSPVWVHIPPADGNKRLLELTSTPERLFLLGLMHGHYDVQNMTDDVADEAVGDVGQGLPQSINTGIGVVIPASKIVETINHPDLVAMRDRLTVFHRLKNGNSD
jgi:hypothetical protein